MERDGFFVIVAKATVEYRAPSFYEDRITIATTLQRGKGRLLEFSYKATNQDGSLSPKGKPGIWSSMLSVAWCPFLTSIRYS